MPSVCPLFSAVLRSINLVAKLSFLGTRQSGMEKSVLYPWGGGEGWGAKQYVGAVTVVVGSFRDCACPPSPQIFLIFPSSFQLVSISPNHPEVATQTLPVRALLLPTGAPGMAPGHIFVGNLPYDVSEEPGQPLSAKLDKCWSIPSGGPAGFSPINRGGGAHAFEIATCLASLISLFSEAKSRLPTEPGETPQPPNDLIQNHWCVTPLSPTSFRLPHR